MGNVHLPLSLWCTVSVLSVFIQYSPVIGTGPETISINRSPYNMNMSSYNITPAAIELNSSEGDLNSL